MLFIILLRSKSLCKLFLLPDWRAGTWSESQHHQLLFKPLPSHQIYNTCMSTQSILKTVLCIKRWLFSLRFCLFVKSAKVLAQQETAVPKGSGILPRPEHWQYYVSQFVKLRFQWLFLAAWLKINENLISCSKTVINKKNVLDFVLLSFSATCVWCCAMMDVKEKNF